MLFSFGYGLYSATSRNWIFDFVRSVKSDVETVIDERANIAKTRPMHFLQPARSHGSGVTVNKTGMDREELVFLYGFFENSNELRLIRRNGEIVVRWIVKFSEIFPDPYHLKKPPSTDWNTDIHGAVALPDGSVVFNFEYAGLVKLDRCSDVVWTLALESHHSVELAEEGGFWVPGRNFYDDDQISPFPPFHPPFHDDTIMKISNDGTLISQISVPKIWHEKEQRRKHQLCSCVLSFPFSIALC